MALYANGKMDWQTLSEIIFDDGNFVVSGLTSEPDR
jgi:hypothetical protein